MGAWGAGNFQNDDALDFLADATAPFVKQMYRMVKSPQRAEPDEPSSSELMAGLEILCVVCENTPAVPPLPALVLRCREVYLPVWDEYIDGLEPAEGFKEERRAVLEATFTRLLKLSEAWHTQT